MNRFKIIANAVLFVLLLVPVFAEAKLSVKMDQPKTTGQKSVLKLTLKNTFTEKIESVRATVFLFDFSGKMVGQATQWIIGGKKDRPPLEPEKETTFNFVIPTDKPFTNTKLIINKLLLTGGKTADVTKEVIIESLEDR